MNWRLLDKMGFTEEKATFLSVVVYKAEDIFLLIIFIIIIFKLKLAKFFKF